MSVGVSLRTDTSNILIAIQANQCLVLADITGCQVRDSETRLWKNEILEFNKFYI